MRFNTRSIRFRLTVWYALILSAALALFGTLTWIMMQQRMLSDLRSGLAEESGRFEAFVRTESAEIPAVDLYDEISEFCHALPNASYLDLLPVKNGLAFHYPASGRAARARYEVLKRPILIHDQPYTYEIGVSRAQMHRSLELLQTLLLSLIPVVIVISCIGGAWLSGRALRPVDDMTAAARAISIENLASRLPLPGTGDELDRLAEVWNTTLTRLESAVATLSRFAADASHELRTPVAVIRTSAELALRRERAPEAYRHALIEIAAESERMTQLVEDLLFLARRDTRGGLTMEPLDLRAVLREAVDDVRGLAETKGIRTHFAAASEASVAGNAAALRRLFLALLDNALKYSPSDTELRVSVSEQGDRVIATVEDQGMGIAAEDLPFIFQRFYRATKSRSDAGHGLGLSLAESVATAHGVAITVTSELGRGSVFQVSFERRIPVEYPAPAAKTEA